MNVPTISRWLTASAAIVTVIGLVVSPAFALGRPLKPTDPSISDNTKTVTTSSSSSAATSTATQAQQAARLKVLQKRANAEIERRINTLNNLIPLINNSQKLTSADKTSLLAEINGEINGDTTFIGLKNLQVQINADTDLATALQNTKTIVTEYRVYLFILPQVRIVSTADQQQSIEAKLTDLAGKLQTRISTAKDQGKNVDALQTQLNSVNQDIASASSQSKSVEQAVLALRPADYDGNTSILKQYRQDLQVVHRANATTLKTAKQIVQGLEQL